jgi:hypothetical protein
MKYWHTRLVLMPVSNDYTIRNIESGQTKCDSRQEMTHEDFFLYVEHFVRFLFMLNKLSRLPGLLNECIHRVKKKFFFSFFQYRFDISSSLLIH